MISIIVPVYNVEEYLGDCLSSIISQDVQSSEYEVLLVDDGSTDSSGKICDEFSRKYDNIKVFHRSNHGLASSRNFGIEKSRGEFLAFVDSDDMICDDFLSKCLGSLQSNDADIVMFNFRFFGSAKVNYEFQIPVYSNSSISGYETLKLLLGNKIRTYACICMYKRGLFDTIRFPDGRNYEDLLTTYRVFNKAKTVNFLNDKLYLYRQRDDSITHLGRSTDIDDILFFNNELSEFIVKNHKELFSLSCSFRLQKLLTALRIATILDEKERYRFIWGKIKELLSNSSIKSYTRLQLLKVIFVRIHLWKPLILHKYRMN